MLTRQTLATWQPQFATPLKKGGNRQLFQVLKSFLKKTNELAHCLHNKIKFNFDHVGLEK